MTPTRTAWTEYDYAARDLARKGIAPVLGTTLPAYMSPESVALINDDIGAFQRHVRAFAYAIVRDRKERE